MSTEPSKSSFEFRICLRISLELNMGFSSEYSWLSLIMRKWREANVMRKLFETFYETKQMSLIKSPQWKELELKPHWFLESTLLGKTGRNQFHFLSPTAIINFLFWEARRVPLAWVTYFSFRVEDAWSGIRATSAFMHDSFVGHRALFHCPLNFFINYFE